MLMIRVPIKALATSFSGKADSAFYPSFICKVTFCKLFPASEFIQILRLWYSHVFRPAVACNVR